MFTLQELAIASDVDLSRIDPYASDDDQRIEMANQLVRKFMKDPENRAYLDEKKANYLHDKGWSVGKKMKHEVDIPQDAFIMLPSKIRNDRKALMKWARTNHPYLFHNQIT